MEIDNILKDREKTAAIWSRVCRTEISDRPVEYNRHEKMLLHFIENKTEAAAYYEMLAKKSRQLYPQFMRMAEAERRHIQKLNAAYFLLTGKSCKSKRPKVSIRTFSGTLRARYEHEVKSSEEYTTAAAVEGDKRFSALFTELAADDRNHADQLRSIAERFVK